MDIITSIVRSGIIILLQAFVGGEDGACPTNWISLTEVCVWISDERLPYWKAVEKCKELDSHLAYIQDEKENWKLAGGTLRARLSVVIAVLDNDSKNIFSKSLMLP